MLEPAADLFSEEDELRAYARMMHHLDVAHFAPWLADDFHYASQWMLAEIESKREYLAYSEPKLEAIKRAGNRVWAEMAREGHPPCLVIAQGNKHHLVANLLFKIAEVRIQRADLCRVPPPQSARRTGDYPV